MSFLLEIFDVFRHLDKHLTEWAQQMGPWLYVALFAVIFAETGLVVTPFLPGDSLLFAIGALCRMGNSVLSLPLIMLVLFVAAVLGDAANYHIGRLLGARVFTSDTSRLLNKKHLIKTQKFYEKYGPKTIIIARFVPIVRTFAPFVAGVGHMQYRRFFVFNVIGAALWVGLLTPAGYAFANVSIVQKHFELVVLAIIAISILPAVIEIIRERRNPTPDPETTPAAES